MIDIFKKTSLLVLLLFGSLAVSAEKVNAYYIVTTSAAYTRTKPNQDAEKVNRYTENDVLFITKISFNNLWAYSFNDSAWISTSYIRPLTENEVKRYMVILKQKGITPESELVKMMPQTEGSKPLRILFWIFIGLVITGAFVIYFLSDEYYRSGKMRDVGMYFAMILLCVAAVILFSYMQYVICRGLAIVGWIQHYILFGWFTDMFVNGILSIIPFILDIPSFGLYGAIAALLPVTAFMGIERVFEKYPFFERFIYAFRIALFFAILVITTDTWFSLFNSFLLLEEVTSIAALVRSCDAGSYANSTFLWAFYIVSLVLLFPPKIFEKYNVFKKK